MKNNIFRGLALFLLPGSFLLAACDDDDLYDVGAPNWLDGEIADVAAKRAAEAGEGNEPVIITTAQAGEQDNSIGWWKAFSQNFEIPVGKTLTVELTNYGSGNELYHGFVPVIANIGRATKDNGDNDDNYKEYFAWNHNWLYTGDVVTGNLCWGNDDWSLSNASSDFDETLGADIKTDDGRAAFKAVMKEAKCTCVFEHLNNGYLFMTNTIEGNGKTIHEYYNQKVSATESVWLFFTMEGAHVTFDKAYLGPCKRTMDDAQPTKLTLTGCTTTLEVGSENYIGDLAATVTYDDGSESKVKADDLSFMAPDVNKLGEQTVIAMYSKTKLGNPAKNSIAATWQVNIVNPVKKVELTSAIPTQYYGGNVTSIFLATGRYDLKLKITYADDTTDDITSADPKVSVTPINVATGKFNIEYSNAADKVSCEATATVTKLDVISDDKVGDDTSVGFFVAQSKSYSVTSGESKAFSFTCHSAAEENWHGPVIVLRTVSLSTNADGVDAKTEYGVMRGDNYGWGNGYVDKATTNCDWVWDDFKAALDNSHWVVTIENVGDGKANVFCSVVDGKGANHFQNYTGIEVTANDLEVMFTSERANLVFD